MVSLKAHNVRMQHRISWTMVPPWDQHMHIPLLFSSTMAPLRAHNILLISWRRGALLDALLGLLQHNHILLQVSRTMSVALGVHHTDILLQLVCPLARPCRQRRVEQRNCPA